MKLKHLFTRKYVLVCKVILLLEQTNFIDLYDLDVLIKNNKKYLRLLIEDLEKSLKKQIEDKVFKDRLDYYLNEMEDFKKLKEEVDKISEKMGKRSK